LAQVLGEWDFSALSLKITPDVLIPRPETEELLEWILHDFIPLLPEGGLSSRGSRGGLDQPWRIADVGTGSGCLAISLAKALPYSTVWAIDLCPKALAVACQNGVSTSVIFTQGDLLGSLLQEKLDIVVANLPYVDEKDMDSLSPEVKHEPALALNGGLEGLALIRRLIPQAASCLKPGGKIYLEVGLDQSPRVVQAMADGGFKEISVKKDFAGIDRFIGGVKS
jgi:release factor glutamine methyltransferase